MLLIGIQFFLYPGITKRKSRQLIVMRVVCGATLVLYYLFSIHPFSNFLVGKLENQYPVFDFQKQDIPENIAAVVILGGGIVQNEKEQAWGGNLGSDAQKRHVYGYLIAQKLDLPVYVTGGIVLGTNTPDNPLMAEADVAKAFLMTLGLPEHRIHVDSKARTTMENAMNIHSMLKKEGRESEKLILVSSAFHIPRSVYSFEKAGLNVIPAAADYKYDDSPFTVVDFIPDAGSLKITSLAIKEYIGMIAYRIWE